MKKYGTIMFLVGFSLFILTPLIKPLSIRGISFDISGLIFQIATTIISLSVLALIYQIFGEEPTISLLNDLRELQKNSKYLQEVGIESLATSRSQYSPEEMHNLVRDAKEVFIIARNFSAIKHNRVKQLFKEILQDKERAIRVIVSSKSTSHRDLKEFKNELSATLRNRFLIRQSSKIMCGMYGTDRKIYVAFYLNTLSGDESPTILCTKNAQKPVYNIYYQEYSEMWENAKEIS